MKTWFWRQCLLHTIGAIIIRCSSREEKTSFPYLNEAWRMWNSDGLSVCSPTPAYGRNWHGSHVWLWRIGFHTDKRVHCVEGWTGGCCSMALSIFCLSNLRVPPLWLESFQPWLWGQDNMYVKSQIIIGIGFLSKLRQWQIWLRALHTVV